MKKLLIILLLCTGCASICNGGWTEKDTMWELASEGLRALDWKQSLVIAKNPNMYYEKNKLLGTHPAIGSVNTYFAGWLILHPVVSCVLPPKARTWWQFLTIVDETPSVYGNIVDLGL